MRVILTDLISLPLIKQPRRAEPIEGPDLSSPTQEAAPPMQMEHSGEGATGKRGGHKGKSSKEKQPVPG